MNSTLPEVEFLTADELLQRVARWEDTEAAHTFIRDLFVGGFRAEGNGYTAWPAYKGYHWTASSKAE